MELNVTGLCRSFGKGQFSLSDISFSVEKGEILALLGESGSGKTTLLRILAGFENADQGTIALEGKTLLSSSQFIRAEQRSIGLVFQDYALFPHMTIAQNIAFGQPKNSAVSIGHWLELVGLPGMEKRYPHQLSGGQQQRIAIARSLAAEPRLLLLDEPFSNLDDSIKSQVRGEIRNILKRSGTTAIFVTHDTRDCLAVADRVMVLSEGKVLQQGSPAELYNSPHSPYVARIFGEINIFSGEVSQRLFGKAKAGIRPQHVLPNGTHNGKVISCRFDGDHYDLEIDLNGTEIHMHSESSFVPGTAISIHFTPEKILFFDHES